MTTANADYRDILHEWIRHRPRNGYGVSKDMAKALGISSVLMSQILSGDREMTPEQGERAARYMGCDDEETGFFLMLVMRQRAGTAALRELFDGAIERRKGRFKNWNKFLSGEVELPPEAKAEYYSSWSYAAIHLLLEMPEFRTPEAIAKRLGLEAEATAAKLRFLVRHGLCVEENGEFKQGPSTVYLPRGSFSRALHTQRRLLALERFERDERDFYFSGLYAIPRAAFDAFKEDLSKAIQRHTREAVALKAEDVFCVNVDAFRV